MQMEAGSSGKPSDLSSPQSTILIIEDDAALRQLMCMTVAKLNHRVISCATAEDGLIQLEETEIDLIVLDLVLPGLNGFEFCKAARAESMVPIIVVSALASPNDVVKILNLGADEFLRKPFQFRQLEAVIYACLRRQGWMTQPLQTSILNVGPVSMNLDERIVTVNNNVVELNQREFSTLELLMRNPGRPHTYERIYETASEYKIGNPRSLVPGIILRLREKIEPNPGAPRVITNVRGFGYRFESISHVAEPDQVDTSQ